MLHMQIPGPHARLSESETERAQQPVQQVLQGIPLFAQREVPPPGSSISQTCVTIGSPRLLVALRSSQAPALEAVSGMGPSTGGEVTALVFLMIAQVVFVRQV